MEPASQRGRDFLPTISDIPKIVAIFLVYVVLGKIGLSFASVNPSATAFWLPTAIALSSLLLYGYRTWPAIFLGAFIVNISTTELFVTSFFIAIGNTLEGLVGAYLINKWAGGVTNVFKKAHNFYRFVLYSVLFSTMISATAGVTTLVLGGLAEWEAYKTIWLTWWLGDATGALIFTPPIILWALNSTIKFKPIKFIEFTALLVGFFFAGQAILDSSFSLSYLVIPILVWLLLRFDPRENATLIAIFSVIIILNTYYNIDQLSFNRSALYAQAFVAILNLSIIPLSILLSDEKRTKKRLNQLAFILESTNSPVIGKTLDGTVTYWNKAAEDLFGYRAEEVMGKNISFYIPEENRGENWYNMEEIKESGRPEYVETTRLRKDGSLVDVFLTHSPIFNNHGDMVGISTIARDITEQKKLEAITRQERLKEEERARREFIDNAAHELRTPLAVIKGNVDLDLKPEAERFSSLKNAVAIIDNEIGQLSKILSNLMKISRDTKQNKNGYEKIDLEKFIKEIVAKYESRYRNEIIFKLGSMPKSKFLLGNKEDLTKLFENIIDNSIHYSESKLKISISGFSDGKNTKIKISDNGIGIAAEDLPHIFEQFYRADKSRSQENGKTGLGLALVKSVAEAHGGGVNVESELGKGSTFTVTLPTHD